MEGYEVLHSIGSGSFGTVYMAKRKATNETVAIKKISKGGRQEREIRSLRQECEIQKKLHHPNIIKMLDSFETDDSVVVVTEYAWGDLCKLLMKERKLAGSRVQFIACNIVSALYFLHSHRILHRDIKPQNILIGLDAHAKLCDFGFARTMGMDTYVLTSIKGTPLYMAPEIVEQRPYDHTADLWSLGCILYELMVGTPPFFTSSLYELVNMIKHRDIYWPENITGDCLSFLKGLLTKDPKKRLSWPDLLNHPFVREGVYINHTVGEFSLTKALSPSQELVKERQRENLQRKLGRYSKLIAKTAIKLKEAQKELKWCSDEGRMMAVQTPLASPNGVQMNKTVAPLKSPIGVPLQDPLKISPNLRPALPDAKNLKVMFQNLNIHDPRPRTREHRDMGPDNDDDDDEVDRNSGASSCETMTSSSECDTDDSDDVDEDSKTVIMDHHMRKKGFAGSHGNPSADHDLEFNDNNRPDKSCSRGGSGQLWKSGALFTLHSFGSEDKPINSDEWVKFIMDTMKEVMDNPKGLCEKHLLTLVVAPLRNHLADPEVVEKIARLLSLPFTLDESVLEAEPGFLSTLQTLYLDTKVLPNMLYSCKLIVRRRRLEHGSVTFEEIPSILTVEDLEGLEKCWRLVTYLVYTDDDFVTQLCDSVCVLQAFAILQLFLKLDAVRPDLTANTIAILCHILRKFPSNKSIVEEIILDENDHSSGDTHCEFWRLITHSNAAIQCQSIRIFAYLRRDSERMRTEFLGKRRSKLWKVFQTAAISEVLDLRKAAKFALRTFNYQQTLALTAKSNSNSSNSGSRIHLGGTVPLAVGSASGACGDSNHSHTDPHMDEMKMAEEVEPPAVDESSGVQLDVLNQDELPNESSR